MCTAVASLYLKIIGSLIWLSIIYISAVYLSQVKVQLM